MAMLRNAMINISSPVRFRTAQDRFAAILTCRRAVLVPSGFLQLRPVLFARPLASRE